MLAAGNCAAPILHRMRFQLSESNLDPAALDKECALWNWVRTGGFTWRYCFAHVSDDARIDAIDITAQHRLARLRG
jgi:hypothetical protein